MIVNLANSPSSFSLSSRKQDPLKPLDPKKRRERGGRNVNWSIKFLVDFTAKDETRTIHTERPHI